MLKDEDIEIQVGRATATGGDFIKIVHKPTGICRGKGPPLVKISKLTRELLREIEAELATRGLTQYIVANGSAKKKTYSRPDKQR